MTRTIVIKNMVCQRCKIVVKQILTDLGFKINVIELGLVKVEENLNIKDIELIKKLEENGFELILKSSDVLIEQIKVFVISQITLGHTENLFQNMAHHLGKTEAVLSKSFSKSEGITLEKFVISLKIEKVKEYIQSSHLNFTEIAYFFNYKTSSHLAKQFKKLTGLSMTEYKNNKTWDRKPLDEIVQEVIRIRK